jgi:DNA-binding winged helix-turn-helix (wHTH) protein/tetratricopeptide (TPR) repeat protein
MSQNRAWAFGEYRLDEQERQLRRGGQVVPLAPKLFDLLAELVRNAGHLLHKEQLLETIWPGVVVEEGTLTRGISSLRQALGPDAGGRDYIETVPKRGYRFTADVRQASAAYVSERAPLAGPPVPPALAAAIAGDFIGRENELIRIQEVWRTARLGHQQLVLIAGEPGVGKTRLSAEFASRCAAQGSAVLAGYCEEEHLVPYQPFIECLTWYFRHCPQAALKAQLAEIGGGGELAAFVPELRTRIPDLPQPVAIDPEGQRYRLFECVGAILSVVSAQRPTLLVFDDIHWADKATLLLVRHLLRSSRPGAFAIVATYRDSELGRTHPLSELLPDLRRETGVTRVALRGLKVEHVRRIVHGIIGPGAPSRLPQIVMDYTDGNPFFATEMLLHLKETGTVTRFNDPATDAADLPVSEGIKEVIGRRLSRLSDSCNRALSVAAVLGREFDVSLMESVADLSENALLDALEEATRAGVLSESSGLEGRFQFRHALIRETLYGELSSPRRARLHRRIGEALEASAREDPDSRLGELAYHFSEAASAGIADKAVDYAIRAGDHAADALAHEDAARLFEMALHSLEFRPAGRETARMRAELHSRRARSFDALGQWSPEIRELEAALEELGEEQSERRCECLLALARAWFLLLDVRPVERYATEGLQIAEAVHRPDLAANAVAWLARCHQANGDLGTAIEMDRRSLVMAPGIMTAADMMGPLTLYLAGRSREALTQAAAAAERARSSRDTTFVMYTSDSTSRRSGATPRRPGPSMTRAVSVGSLEHSRCWLVRPPWPRDFDWRCSTMTARRRFRPRRASWRARPGSSRR